MADNLEDRLDAPADGDNALAAQIALGEQGHHGKEAREYLRKQSRIADLQIDTLKKKDEFELSHLRFRRYSDWTKFALEISGFLVVLLIVCGLATMVWNASQDHDLVVDSFSVPADVAQSGMTGSVLAGRILDRFGRMQSQTIAFSQGAASYRGNAANDVRVEIPSTGISLGELNRYLREWLGHEVHVSGDLVHAGPGLALTTRYGAEPGATVTGKQGDLDNLVDKSAEQIFAAALPYRYVEYLVHKQRFVEASALLPALAERGSMKDRALANEDWAKVYFFQGEMRRALEKGREAVRLDPDSSMSHGWLGAAEGNIGHDENSYLNLEAAMRNFGDYSGADQRVLLRFSFEAFRDEYTGDFADAVRAWRQLADSEPSLGRDAGNASGDAAADHDIPAARRFAAMIKPKDSYGRPEPQQPVASFYIHVAEGNWTSAVKDGAAAKGILNTQPDQKWSAFLLASDVAYATARAGDFKAADAIIVHMPTDCDTCQRARARIAALEGHWIEAARDFATVAARSPHEPFAETWWGELLMGKGDLDGAITKFAVASRKGPHFADPLEMWGEALMQKNRSDLALAKFEEANTYAPNWGRLHLKWGEALWWSGRRNEAQNQFAAAAGLDLSVAEKAELARVSHG
jgi:tetratricopeptide (TPR) repeat protein